MVKNKRTPLLRKSCIFVATSLKSRLTMSEDGDRLRLP